MKRDLTVTKAGPPTNGSSTGFSEVPRAWVQAARSAPSAWRHTLILTGSLNTSSAPDLQEEIECLYQEGVTSVVLDLRQLDVIELGAVQTVASLSALYKRRGIAVAAIGGCASVHHALIEAETTSERIASRRFSRYLDDAVPARSTEVVKVL